MVCFAGLLVLHNRLLEQACAQAGMFAHFDSATHPESCCPFAGLQAMGAPSSNMAALLAATSSADAVHVEPMNQVTLCRLSNGVELRISISADTLQSHFAAPSG